MAAEDEAGLLAQEYAAWGRAAEAWLDRVGACIEGRLMPADLVALVADFDMLADSLHQLGRRLNRSRRHERPPVDFAALEHRVAELQVPALCDRILSHFPAPGAAGREPVQADQVNLPAAVDLLLFLEAAGPRLFHRRIGGRRRQRLCADLAALGSSYHRRVMDGFAALDTPLLPGEIEGRGNGVAQDPAEGPAEALAGRDSLRTANYNQIRMDLLHWLLEALGDRKAAEQIRHLSRITARTAVRLVDRELTAYLETHDPSTRIRLRPVLEAVDEAIALIRAVLPGDGDAAGAAEGGRGAGAPLHYFVRDLGAEVAEPFVRHMGLLVIALFEDLQAASARGGMSPAALRGGLQRMQEALAFCRLIDHPMGREAHARAIRVIRRRGDALVQDLGRNVAAAPSPERAEEARAALRVLQEFIERWRRGEASQDDGEEGGER